MPDTDLTKPDALADFERRQITLQGKSKLVFVAGSGPAVIVMTEMPGISPHVGPLRALGARRRVHRLDAAICSAMPGRSDVDRAIRSARSLKGCISAEFRAFAANASSPVTRWLRALAAHAHPLCGGKGVGAIGMCFTGNFALSMMLEPAMLAPVLSQPSLPLANARGMHIAPDGAEVGEAAARARGPDRARLSLRRRPLLPRRALRRLPAGAWAIASRRACCPTAPPTRTHR